MNLRDPFLNDRSVEQMLCDNSVTALDRQISVPNAVWINHQPRSTATNAKARGLRAQDRQRMCFERLLEMLPNPQTFFA